MLVSVFFSWFVPKSGAKLPFFFDIHKYFEKKMRKSCVYAEFFIILHSQIEKITKIVVIYEKNNSVRTAHSLCYSSECY